MHGNNATHDSSECYSLKNYAKAEMQSSNAKVSSSHTFTEKSLERKSTCWQKNPQKKNP